MKQIPVYHIIKIPGSKPVEIMAPLTEPKKIRQGPRAMITPIENDMDANRAVCEYGCKYMDANRAVCEDLCEDLVRK